MNGWEGYLTRSSGCDKVKVLIGDTSSYNRKGICVDYTILEDTVHMMLSLINVNSASPQELTEMWQKKGLKQ